MAFIGALFIIKPQSISASLPSFVGMLGGFGAGVAYTMVRKLSQKGERGPFIVFFFSAFSCVVTLPYLIVDYSPMTIAQLVILICAGIAAAGGQFFDYCRIFICTGKRNIGVRLYANNICGTYGVYSIRRYSR